jgi:hypothetical protein
LSQIEYAKATEREPSKWRVAGMEAGIAKKSGNADGVKASTAVESERTNIPYMQR